jgi:hypothetical protein
MAVVTLDRLTKIYDRAHAPAADCRLARGRHGEFMVLLGHRAAARPRRSG